MYFQEYRIHLINGHVIKAAEDCNIPDEKRLLSRFKASHADGFISIGSVDSSRAVIPVRNILYISTGNVVNW